MVPSTLFVSYAHEDEDWLKRIQPFLKILKLDRQVHLKVWSDRELKPGDDWEAIIDEKLQAAKVAILIVTVNFLDSDFIMEKELPYLLQRRETASLKIIPVLARQCNYERIQGLGSLQFVTVKGRALQAGSDDDVDTALKGLVDELCDIYAPDRESPICSESTHKVEIDRHPYIHDQKHTLELSLRHRCGEEYHVDLRYTDLYDANQSDFHTYRTRISLTDLDALRDRAEDYASLLDRRIFTEGASRAILARYTQQLGIYSTRLRVNVEATARELHRVFWETLPLAHSADHPSHMARQVFVRSVSSAGEGWPPPELCAKPDFKVVLCTLDPAGVSTSVRLLDAYVSALPEHSVVHVPNDPMKWEDLAAIDAKILLLALHIDSREREPVILALDGEGMTREYSIEDFTKCIRDMSNHPQVVILDSWNANGETQPVEWIEKALVLFASELITTGICAVVTRQGPMDLALWIRFLGEFASVLKDSGNIDLATSAGRFAVGQHDGWKPVVLTRLRAGQLWYTPQFRGDSATAWDILVDRIQEGLCVPIIGPQVSRHVMRSRGDIAERWSKKYHYPGVSQDCRELRKVAQYVATTHELRKVRKGYREAVIEYLTERYGNALRDLGSDRSLMDILKGIWDNLLSERGDDPYNLLANLRLPLYLTTNLHNYLSLAMTSRAGTLSIRHGDEPAVRVRERIFAEKEQIHGDEEDRDDRTFALNRNRPLVYHLFGHLTKLETMVLTEDDHFRFLLQFHGKWDRLPLLLRNHVSDSALVFLGFDLGEWEFRSLFQALLDIHGSRSFHKNTHVAVQIGLDDDTIADPERTQTYLEKYFRQIGENPFVFLGSAQDFLSQLNQRLKEAGGYGY